MKSGHNELASRKPNHCTCEQQVFVAQQWCQGDRESRWTRRENLLGHCSRRVAVVVVVVSWQRWRKWKKKKKKMKKKKQQRETPEDGKRMGPTGRLLEGESCEPKGNEKPFSNFFPESHKPSCLPGCLSPNRGHALSLSHLVCLSPSLSPLLARQLCSSVIRVFSSSVSVPNQLGTLITNCLTITGEHNRVSRKEKGPTKRERERESKRERRNPH